MAPERLAVVGTGLIGASVALAAKRGRDVSIMGFDPDPAALDAAVERGAVDSAADSLEAALADAELAVVAAPVAQLAAQVRAALEASPGRLHGHRRRLDEGCRLRGRAGIPEVCRGTPGVRFPRRAAPSTRALTCSTARRGFYSSRRDRSRPLPVGTRLRLQPRRDSGRRRSAGSRPPGRDHQPPAARAGEPARQPGRRRQDRGPRAARRGRRLAARHDASRRRQPSDLGRHLPRQRCSAPRVARGAPPSDRAARSRAGRGRRRLPRALDRRGGRQSQAHAGRRVSRLGRPPAAPRARARPARRARGDHAGPRRARGSTSKTSSCTTSRPIGAGR